MQKAAPFSSLSGAGQLLGAVKEIILGGHRHAEGIGMRSFLREQGDGQGKQFFKGVQGKLVDEAIIFDRFRGIRGMVCGEEEGKG